MRKTNNNIKRSKIKKKLIKSFVIFHVLLVLFFMVGFFASKPIDIKNCKTELICIENKEYRYPYGELKFCVFTNGVKYEFPNMGIFSDYNYSPTYLYDRIAVGESLEISYTEVRSLLSKRNLIVNAKDENCTYFDFDTYNKFRAKGNVAMIVLFSIIELLFVFIFAFSIYFNREILFKTRFRRKNRQNIIWSDVL